MFLYPKFFDLYITFILNNYISLSNSERSLNILGQPNAPVNIERPQDHDDPSPLPTSLKTKSNGIYTEVRL